MNAANATDALDHLPLRLWIRPTKNGSNYFGPCDYCGKHMSEAVALMTGRVGPTGKLLAPNPSGYGHALCVEDVIARATRSAS